MESARTGPPAGAGSLDIGVVGAGAIGSVFGSVLAAAGFHVRFIEASPTRVAAINTGNLRLVCDAGPDPARPVPPAAVNEVPAGTKFDVLLFTVKGYATEAAAASVSSCLRDGGVVISVQNGLGINEQLARHFDRSRIAVGSTTVSAAVTDPGNTQVTLDTWLGRSRTVLGATRTLAPSALSTLSRFAGALSVSGLPAATSESVDNVIWTKLAYAVSIGTVCAVADANIASALGTASGRHLVRTIFGEVCAVAQAVQIPLDAEAAWNDAVDFWSSIGNHVPSMAIDVRAGRRSEVDSFALAVARLGARVGAPAPYCQCLGELIKIKELATSLSPAKNTICGDRTVSNGGCVLDFHDEVVLVAGGAGEIGAATAELLASLGASVHIADVDETRGEQVLASLNGYGGKPSFSRIDMTIQDEVERWVQDVLREHGKIQVAVNTVGWTQSSNFVDETDAYWRKVLDVNLMSCVYLAHAVIPAMQKEGYGRIILMSSLSGRIGRRYRTMYGAAKAGVIGFSKALAREVALDGITVNGVAPGTTETAMMRAQGEENTRFALAGIPIGKIAMPADQAAAVAFLASRQASHMTGQTISVDGGSTMV